VIVIPQIGDDITVDQFIINCAKKIPKQDNIHVIFFYAGHSFVYYLRNGKKHVQLSSLRKALSLLQPNLCVFDSCAMSSLECLYELSDCTDYVLGCEGYGSDKGFLTENTIEYLNEYANDGNVIRLGEQMLRDAYLQNRTYEKPWNASLCSTYDVQEFVNHTKHTTLSHSLPFVCEQFPLIDLSTFLNKKVPVISFRQNKFDSKKCKGISFCLWVKKTRDDEYKTCRLYKDIKWIRELHDTYDYTQRLLYTDINVNHYHLKEELELDEVRDMKDIEEIKDKDINYINAYQKYGLIVHIK
jgi:hypothetical protein